MQQSTNRNIRRAITFGLGMALGLSFLTGTASAAPGKSADTKERGNQGQTSSTKDCDGTHHSKTGHGANTSGAYDTTCDGSPSENGGGGGDAGGKPCAGCVGNADDKNPAGQYPDGPTDHNNGYECDQKGRSEDEGNNGIGFGNPAHTGCEGVDDTDGTTGTPLVCPAGAAAMTSHHFVVDGTTVGDLTGNVDVDDHVVANFTIAAECPAQPVTLVSYEVRGNGHAATRTVFDSGTGSFGGGDHTLDVDVPSCAFAVELLLGDRVIDTDHDGSPSCDAPLVPGPAVIPASFGSTPTGDVLAAVVPAAPEAAPAASVLAAGLLPETPAPAAAGRAAEVLGVQLERGAPSGAGLARTGGLGLVPLAGFGAALCLLGVALASPRRRAVGRV